MYFDNVRCYGKAIRNGRKVICPHIDECARYANPVTNPWFTFLDNVPFRKYTCREYRKKIYGDDKARMEMLAELEAEKKAKREANKKNKAKIESKPKLNNKKKIIKRK